MQSPYEIAAALYDGGDLGAIIAFCANCGFVHADSDIFVCAFPTHHSFVGNKLQICVDKPDTWYVYIASGDIKRGFDILPPLDFIAYRRMDDKFRVIGFNRLRRLLWATR